MSIQHKLQKPLGLLTLLGLACIITAYVVALVENTDYWPFLCIVVGGLFNLAGYLTGSTALYIAGAGSIAWLLSEDNNSFNLPSEKNTHKVLAQAALFLIGSVLTFVGYPFKPPKSLKIDVFTLLAFLGIGCSVAAAITVWAQKGSNLLVFAPTGGQGTIYIYVVILFLWGTFGGSTAAQYLTIFCGFAHASSLFYTLSQVSDNPAAQKAAWALGLCGSSIMAGLTTFLMSQNRQSDEEAPLLR
eukprot:TRINITY_DN2156_c0_g1_i2.p1 TRINITY_DN2156_c0_g1~~TRINITY_DN2156_c0_g1_i2.p1  ORF type:complete len:244 (-),score=49.21 TRINITY_DN2156_c0_g1_i2:135-866(-)